jgi:hypothetical protein
MKHAAIPYTGQIAAEDKGNVISVIQYDNSIR